MAETINNINEIQPTEPTVLVENIAQDAAAIGDAASGSLHKYAELLSTQAGYTELGIIAAAVLGSWLAAQLIDWLTYKRFPELFSTQWEWVTRPLKLLPPLLTILALMVMTPMAVTLVKTPMVMSLAIRIATAWLFIRATFMLVSSRAMAWIVSGLITMVVSLDAFDLLAPTKQLLEGIGFSVGDSKITLMGAFNGIVLCILLFWLALASSRRIEKQLRRSRMHYNVRELMIKFSKILLFTIAVLASLSAMGVDLTALAVFGGALGVGIGFGLQSITSNFVSGIILLMEKTIKQGDLIEVGTVHGYVRELNIRYTMIETFSGQEVSVPNETLLSNNLINYTMTNSRARVEIPVGVAYGSDYALVQDLMLKAATNHPRCISEPEPACFMREFADSSVNFLLQFWVEDVKDGRYGPHSEVMFEIAKAFDEHSIEIPFPQRDVHLIQAAV